jgi:dTDP-4-dehydrorhamnose reductase
MLIPFKKKIVILGASGGLGQELMKVYSNHQVTGLSKEELDITNFKSVKVFLTILKPDIVYNCAAYTNVDGAETNKDLADNINGFAVGNLAKICNELGATFVHFSTGMIFDGKRKSGYNENSRTSPVNAYGESKLLGERQVLSNTKRFYVIRTCWLYGSLGGKKSFVDLMLGLKDKKEVKIVTEEFGSPTLIEDLAISSKLIIDMKYPYGFYHITNSGVTSRDEFAKAIFEILGIPKKVKLVNSDFFPRVAIRPKYEFLKNNKFIEPRNWKEALVDFLTNPIRPDK